jgi:UDP-N-acetylglucosamine--N-acetylmuramyl-(pentapeptide) pyrophosphoryl-undecaprenol N-acetylglucosamine transferase
MSKLKKVLIMAGGTGGHIFPGLAVAKLLRSQQVEVHWLGTHKGLEARVIPEAGFPLHFISINGLRGKGIKDLLLAPFRLCHAIYQSLQIIRQVKPDVILGMGGFVSGPGGIASWLLRCPLVIHEQNAKIGLTNRWLAHVATKTLEGFPNVFPLRQKAVTTGNPVRMEIAMVASPEQRFAGRKPPLCLLVLGGSLGAAAINDLIPLALAKIPSAERPQVYHQTGEKHFDKTLQAYQVAGVTANVVPFITEMDQAYAWADVVLCRAGALTIAELCAAGLGAILVPYPYAVDDHQTANADYLVKHQAAVLVSQTALTENRLIELLQQLSASPERREAMAQAAYRLRRVEATNEILTICEEICS